MRDVFERVLVHNTNELEMSDTPQNLPRRTEMPFLASFEFVWYNLPSEVSNASKMGICERLASRAYFSRENIERATFLLIVCIVSVYI